MAILRGKDMWISRKEYKRLQEKQNELISQVLELEKKLSQDIISIKNYREVIRTLNDDGTDRVEVIGVKMMDKDGNKIETNLVFPRVLGDELLADYTTDKDGEIFEIHIPIKLIN